MSSSIFIRYLAIVLLAVYLGIGVFALAHSIRMEVGGAMPGCHETTASEQAICGSLSSGIQHFQNASLTKKSLLDFAAIVFLALSFGMIIRNPLLFRILSFAAIRVRIRSPYQDFFSQGILNPKAP